MEHITVTELKQIKEKQDENRIEPDDAFIDLDFATEDFINKNIRVRPISGVTHADETKDGRATHKSEGGGDDGEDALENYNAYALIEIQNQRDTVKKKLRELNEEQRRKQALEEKKL